MRTYYHFITLTCQIIQHAFQTAVHDIVLLPGRRDQNMLFLMRRLIRFPVIFDHTIQQAVAPVDQFLGRQTVSFLCLADFLSMMLTDAVYGIVVIHGTGTHGHIQTVHTMRNIDIFNILPYIASLNMEVLNIRHSHDHYVCIHLHHQCDQTFFSDIIRPDLVFFFRQCKDLIFRITGDIVDSQIGMFQEPFDNALIIFIEATALGIKYQMLVHYREETFEIFLLSLGIGIFLEEFLLATNGLQFLQFLFAGLQFLIIHIILGIDGPVQQILL